MRIAIAGPDGAGKSSISKALFEKMQPASLIYAGKRNHYFHSTAYALSVWKNLQRFGLIPSIIAQYFIFYPIEYRDNLKKFQCPLHDVIHIYDRHPIDRIMMIYELKLRYHAKKIRQARFFMEYLPRSFWNYIYRKCFPQIERIYILLPEPTLCFNRSNGQYQSIDDAKIKIEAYKMATNDWDPKKTHTKYISIYSSTSVKDICNIIMKDINWHAV